MFLKVLIQSHPQKATEEVSEWCPQVLTGGPDMSLVASLQRVDASLARPSDFGETQVDSDESAEPFQIRCDFALRIYSEHHSILFS